MTDAKEPTLQDLFAELVEAKQVEKAANLARIACEQRIIAHIADRPESGSVKLQGGPVRCTVKFGMNYKVDVEAMREAEGVLPGFLPLKMIPAQPVSYAFDEKAYEELREKHPAVFAKLAGFVTATPAKPSVELKL